MNISDLLVQAGRRYPDRWAIFVGTEPCLTWAQLHERAFRLARVQRERYGAGARIAIVSENCPEMLELLFGTWSAGQVAVPINYKLHPKEMAQIAADAGAAAIHASASLVGGLQEVLSSDAAAARADVLVIGSPGYEALFAGPRGEIAPTTPETLAWLFYTSGTTGRAKGAMLSHRNLMAMTLAHLADVDSPDEHGSQIHAAPMSHGSGLYIPAYVARGARQVIPASRGFDADEFLDLCEAHPACASFLAPTMVQRLRRAAEAAGGRRPAGLRTIVYGGGPMYVDELKRSLRTFGDVFVQIYGQGESPMTITSLRRADHAGDSDAVLGSVGWARTGVRVAVVDSDGEPLPAGRQGEIVCRGDVVMQGYWQHPEATAATLKDGWLHTGDIGSLDARGYLTLHDRSKDVVISGGSNIYPREVEEALLAHPAVAEAAVVGQGDAEWGEVVVAFIVAEPGRAVEPAELDAHCLGRIARFKKPKRYLFVDELPKNSYGKVLKRELRASLGSGG